MRIHTHIQPDAVVQPSCTRSAQSNRLFRSKSSKYVTWNGFPRAHGYFEQGNYGVSLAQLRRLDLGLRDSSVVTAHVYDDSCYRLKLFKAVVIVVVEASAPKVYLRVTLASASILSGSVVRALRGGEGLPKIFCLVASSLGHLRSQRLIVCDSSLQRGHRGSAEGSKRLA